MRSNLYEKWCTKVLIVIVAINKKDLPDLCSNVDPEERIEVTNKQIVKLGIESIYMGTYKSHLCVLRCLKG
jgi:hypothetical protein